VLALLPTFLHCPDLPENTICPKTVPTRHPNFYTTSEWRQSRKNNADAN